MATEQDSGASGANNVWNMVQALGSSAISAYRDINVARTTSTPNPSATNRNPPPGSLGSFPQAQTKPSYEGGVDVKTWGVWAAVVGVVLLLLIVLPRGR